MDFTEEKKTVCDSHKRLLNNYQLLHLFVNFLRDVSVCDAWPAAATERIQ